jgi:NADH:ubiquinone oxidoreductase subunit 4 (subunit M)
MSDWMATILICVPIIGALVVWLLPLTRFWAGGLALLVALVEIGFWINAVTLFDFGEGLQAEQRVTGSAGSRSS